MTSLDQSNFVKSVTEEYAEARGTGKLRHYASPGQDGEAPMLESLEKKKAEAL